MPIDSQILQRLRENDPTLTLLVLRHLDQQGILELAKVLIKTNTTLTTLNLTNSQIRNEGAQALAEALKTNTVLTRLDLAYNEIDHGMVQNINGHLEYNQRIAQESDPHKKANLIGQKKGTYTVPSLRDLAGFKVKQELSKPASRMIDLEDMNKLPEEVCEHYGLPAPITRNFASVSFDRKTYLLNLKDEVVKSEWNDKGKSIGSWSKLPDGIEKLRNVLNDLTDKSGDEAVKDCFSKTFEIIKAKHGKYRKNVDFTNSVTEQTRFYKKTYEEMQEISEKLIPSSPAKVKVEQLIEEHDQMFSL